MAAECRSLSERITGNACSLLGIVEAFGMLTRIREGWYPDRNLGQLVSNCNVVHINSPRRAH
jgi:hypothetical protein